MIKNEYACQVITRSEWPIQLKRWLYTLFFFYKNIFYKNIEAEICEILRIF